MSLSHRLAPDFGHGDALNEGRVPLNVLAELLVLLLLLNLIVGHFRLLVR